MEKPRVSSGKGEEGEGQGLLKVIKKLPVGFRFLPSDEELLVHYLSRRTSGMLSLASTFIPELDVFKADPWSLPGDQREKRFFFCRRVANQYSNRRRLRIPTSSGHWKILGKVKQVSSTYGSTRVAGVRRTLAFRSNLSDVHGDSSFNPRWILHEISLIRDDESRREDGDWAVYRLFQKKKISPTRKRDIPRAIAICDSPCSISVTTEENL
ncbi:hypothetical protein MLD38_040651 [Melastoma candidum]|nr:hypothetical protein MLD38_040651 [Melastoma candidum]